MIKKAVHVSGIKHMNTEHNKKQKCYQNKGSKVQYVRTAVNTLFVFDRILKRPTGFHEIFIPKTKNWVLFVVG